ncbi:MAG: hypothetical protein EKK48_10360 [Candidatus Melainabacteria bacterium]|nr:MAG: hypothetical protein EKK48_10360 [Candidatus Melainabacteria bacterium]
MSANNGIYILKTKATNGAFEYRVREVHAIENLFDGNNGNLPREKELCSLFGASEILKEDFDAFSVANDLLVELEEQGLEVEFGVLVLELDSVFPACA